jgi:hypothetical protein
LARRPSAGLLCLALLFGIVIGGALTLAFIG